MDIITTNPGGYRGYTAGSGGFDHLAARQTSASNTTGTAANSAVKTDTATAVAPVGFDAETASRNILAFIQQRLSQAADQGASQDELAALLAQARQGVSAGVGKAVQQLKDSGAFTDALGSGISATLQKVDGGLDELAKQYGVATDSGTAADTAPAASTGATAATATPAASAGNTTTTPQTGTLTQLAAVYRARLSSRQSVDLVVKTADGDTVRLQLRLRDTQKISAAYQSNADGRQLSLSSSEKSSGRLRISVDGNLDAGELSALNDLLNQVGNLADSFFSGDVAGALQQAGALDFSNPELNAFSLDLRSQVSVRTKVAAYAAVQSLGNDSGSAAAAPTAADQADTAAASQAPAAAAAQAPNAQTGLANGLSSLLPGASLVSNPANLLKQLLAAQIGAGNLQDNPLLSFADRLLAALGADGPAASSTDTSAASGSTPAAAEPTTSA